MEAGDSDRARPRELPGVRSRMRLRSLRLEGFRGSLPAFKLQLDGRSLCLLGENGHGKTTIVDALELWGTGDLEAFHRAGAGLDAAIHLDAREAQVACAVDGYPVLVRRLSGRASTPLVPQGPIEAGQLPEPLPALRHRTMADFMTKSAGDKLKALLEIVGLSALTDFRATTVTVANSLQRRADEEARTLEAEQRTLANELDGESLVAAAERLRREARLREPIISEAGLRSYVLAPDTATSRDLPSLVADLERALEHLALEPAHRWNGIVSEVETARAAAVVALIRAGERVLIDWDADTCPLCLQGQAREGLSESLRQRAADLAGRTEALRASGQALERFKSSVATVGRALAEMIRNAPRGGWPGPVRLEDAKADFGRAWASVNVAERDGTTVFVPDPEVLLKSRLTFRMAADANSDEAQPLRALSNLTRLQQQSLRIERAARTAARSHRIAAEMGVFRDLVNETVRCVIEDVLAEIGEKAAEFYGVLVASPVYSGVRLKYGKAGSAGGVEFELVYDNRHPVSPPRRVMSESELNALGLSLFLAQLHVHKDQPWRTLVLDDVVNSFDSGRRGALAGLLSTDFSDWQVLLFTHDPVFAAHNRRVLTKGWIHNEIVGWSPTGGMTVDDGNPLAQLRRRVAAGEAASQLGGLARRALENELAKPVEKLKLKLPYQRDPRYTAADLLGALKAAAKRGTLQLDVLDRIAGASYFVNFTAHERSYQGAIASGEMAMLIEHLGELNRAFRCGVCEKHVWHLSTGDGRAYQCACRGLALSA